MMDGAPPRGNQTVSRAPPEGITRPRAGWEGRREAIGLLELSIVATTVVAARVSRVAAALLTPYALWTAFASVLNARIWQLNRRSIRPVPRLSADFGWRG